MIISDLLNSKEKKSKEYIEKVKISSDLDNLSREIISFLDRTNNYIYFIHEIDKVTEAPRDTGETQNVRSLLNLRNTEKLIREKYIENGLTLVGRRIKFLEKINLDIKFLQEHESFLSLIRKIEIQIIELSKKYIHDQSVVDFTVENLKVTSNLYVLYSTLIMNYMKLNKDRSKIYNDLELKIKEILKNETRILPDDKLKIYNQLDKLRKGSKQQNLIDQEKVRKELDIHFGFSRTYINIKDASKTAQEIKKIKILISKLTDSQDIEEYQNQLVGLEDFLNRSVS